MLGSGLDVLEWVSCTPKLVLPLKPLWLGVGVGESALSHKASNRSCCSSGDGELKIARKGDTNVFLRRLWVMMIPICFERGQAIGDCGREEPGRDQGVPPRDGEDTLLERAGVGDRERGAIEFRRSKEANRLMSSLPWLLLPQKFDSDWDVAERESEEVERTLLERAGRCCFGLWTD